MSEALAIEAADNIVVDIATALAGYTNEELEAALAHERSERPDGWLVGAISQFLADDPDSWRGELT